jgi:hypothetical protein
LDTKLDGVNAGDDFASAHSAIDDLLKGSGIQQPKVEGQSNAQDDFASAHSAIDDVLNQSGIGQHASKPVKAPSPWPTQIRNEIVPNRAVTLAGLDKSKETHDTIKQKLLVEMGFDPEVAKSEPYEHRVKDPLAYITPSGEFTALIPANEYDYLQKRALASRPKKVEPQQAGANQPELMPSRTEIGPDTSGGLLDSIASIFRQHNITPGLESVNTPEGPKTDVAESMLKRGAKGATLGLYDPAPVVAVTPGRQQLVDDMGTMSEFIGSLAPYAGMSKVVKLGYAIPRVAAAMKRLEAAGKLGEIIERAAQSGAMFGGVAAGREGIKVARGEQSVGGAIKRTATETGLGATVGALARPGANTVEQGLAFGVPSTALAAAQGEAHSPVELTGNPIVDSAIFNTVLGWSVAHPAEPGAVEPVADVESSATPEPVPVAEPAARNLHHEQFGRVSVSPEQAGIPVGRLRVVDEAGASHVIKNPRTAGNQVATFVKPDAVPGTVAERSGSVDNFEASHLAVDQVLKQAGVEVPANDTQAGVQASRAEPEFVARSRARIRESLTGQRMNSNPVQDLYDSAIVTGHTLYTKTRGFKDWAGKMVEEHGPEIKAHLADIWARLETEADREFWRNESPMPLDSPQAEKMGAAWEDVSPVYARDTASGAEGGAKTKWLPYLNSYMNANILAGASPYTHKLLALATDPIRLEAARPFAAAADAVRSKIEGEPRSVYLDPRGLARAAYESLKAVPEAARIFKNGYTPETLSRYGAPNEVTGHNPLFRGLINYTFRAYRAGAHVPMTYAYERSMHNQAKVIAEGELKNGAIERGEVNGRIGEIMRGENVDQSTHAMLESNSINAAIDAVFMSDNAITRGLQRAKNVPVFGQPREAVKFAINRTMPFTRAASNTLIKSADALQVGPHGVPVEMVRALVRKYDTGSAFNSPQERRAFANAWGNLPVSAGLVALGYALQRNGQMVGLGGSYDERRTREMAGQTPGSVRIGGRWVDVARLGPGGLMMAMGATIGAQKDRPKAKDKSGVIESVQEFLSDVSEALPLAQGPRMISRLGKIVTGPDRGAKALDEVRRQALPLVPMYSTVRDVAQGNENSVRRLSPGAASVLLGPERKDALGQTPPDTGYLPRVLHYRNAVDDPVVNELLKHRVNVQQPFATDRQGRPVDAQKLARIGPARKARVASVISDPRYDEPPAEFGDAQLEWHQKLVLTEALRAGQGNNRNVAGEEDQDLIFHNAQVAHSMFDTLGSLESVKRRLKLSPGDFEKVKQAIQSTYKHAKAKYGQDDSFEEQMRAENAFDRIREHPSRVIESAVEGVKRGRASQ